MQRQFLPFWPLCNNIACAADSSIGQRTDGQRHLAEKSQNPFSIYHNLRLVSVASSFYFDTTELTPLQMFFLGCCSGFAQGFFFRLIQSLPFCTNILPKSTLSRTVACVSKIYWRLGTSLAFSCLARLSRLLRRGQLHLETPLASSRVGWAGMELMMAGMGIQTSAVSMLESRTGFFPLRTSAGSWKRRCLRTPKSPRMRRRLSRNVSQSLSASSQASEFA